MSFFGITTFNVCNFRTESLWYWNENHRVMRVGVIGGGVNGTAIAYFLKKFGAEDVTIFEKNNIGGISTSKSIGIVRHHYANPHHIKIVKRSREILERLEDFIDRTGDFRKNGYLGVAGYENEDTFTEIVNNQQQLGIDVELLDPEELPEYLPAINPEGLAIGALEKDAGFADPYQISMGFANKARELGVEIKTDTEVKNIETDGKGAIESIITSSENYSFDFLVNCAGPYGSVIAEMVDIEIPKKWYEVKVTVLSASTSYDAQLPTMSDMDSAFYTKPEEGGDFIASGFNDPEMDDLEGGFEGVTTDDLNKLSELLEFRLPGYADAKLANTWSGIITASPDWYQIVGIPKGMHNFYNMINGSGHGFKEAPAFAESIAQDILSKDPEFDLHPYRLERFDENDQIKGAYGSAGWFG